MKCEDKLARISEIVDGNPKGDLSIVVLHRGWIFVGEFAQDENACCLTRCENVRKWTSGGFGGLTLGAKSSGAVLDKCEPMEFDTSAMILCVDVAEGWHNA